MIAEEEKLDLYKMKMENEDKKNTIKKTKTYFEICKRNINSEKKKKFEINEGLLEVDLKKKVLLELKYHELSSKIGWIQISIIIASTAITFIQTADGVFIFPEDYIATVVSISLSTYVALILAISRFFKFDELKEQIVNVLSTFALYINKLKIRKQILIDHNFDYYKRDIDYEYNEWNKLKELFEKDGSAELKVSIDNEIDMLLTKKDELKYREEMITLQLQEFIIEQQDTIYSKMEPLMFSQLYKYKTNVGCLNYIFTRIFHTSKFHKKARDMYCTQEIEKVSHANDIEVKTNMLKKLNNELKELYRENKLLNKVKHQVEDTELRKKMEQLIEKKLNIREDLINTRSSVDDTKKLLKAYRMNQNTEKIHHALVNNARIEHDLGIRDFEAFNYDDIEKKEEALKNYNYIFNQNSNKIKEMDKMNQVVSKETEELYYPDEYYGLTERDLKIHNNQYDIENQIKKRHYANSLSSSFSYSTSESEKGLNGKEKIFNKIRKNTIRNEEVEAHQTGNIRFEKNYLEDDEVIEEIELRNEDTSSKNSKNESGSSTPPNNNTSVIGKLFGYPNNDSDFDLNDKM